MPPHDLRSTHLATADYDPDRQTLDVKFRTGKVYRYFDVPAAVFDELLAAPSAGRYFNTKIRERYRAELVYDVRKGGPVR
jgi:lysyl-tRNA synthetase class 2